jgi:hypothetical protein
MNSIIKLTNGDTIIGEIIHQDEHITSILEPLQLDIAESYETERPMMVAMTWMPLIKKINLVNIRTLHVIAVSECGDEIEGYYKKSLKILKNEGFVDDIEEESQQVIDDQIEESANTVLH